MTHYEVLLFDADGTLFDFNKSSKEAFRHTMEHLNIPYTIELQTRYMEINQELWQQLEHQRLDAPKLRKKRYELLFREFNIPQDPVAADLEYIRQLGQLPHLISGAKEVLRTLSQRHRIAIVTNGLAETQRPRLENSALKPYIEKNYISDEIGYAKPDVHFFEYVFAHMAPMNRRKTLIIGDSLTADIKGGLDSGIHTCWYNPLGVTNHTKIKPTYEIRAMEEILEIV